VQTPIYAELLGFKTSYSSVSYNQLSRGLEEQASLSIIDEIMQVVNRLASDIIFMASDINGWISADASQVSGSSIMPQKKNPDAWELIRAETHRFSGAISELKGITTNMSSGYHRDLQRVKHVFMAAIRHADELLDVVYQALSGIVFNVEKCQKALKPELFATHIANKLTKDGMPFRDAYKKAAEVYDKADFQTDEIAQSYLYKGTPGNANLEAIKKLLVSFSEDVSKRKQFFVSTIRKLTM
jgi:argininosuccinate lyase